MSSEGGTPQGISLVHEEALWRRGLRCVAGVDEAGRGPLAGPVVAAAVIFPPGLRIAGVDDSKRLSAARREELFSVIHENAITVGVGIVGHLEIDESNILLATYTAMHAALASLAMPAEHVLVDGNRFVGSGIPFTTIVDGDAHCHAIAAASIVAKVTRDRLMCEYDRQYPGYGFAQHKGYGTPAHLDALVRLGMCPIHRRSFLGRILAGTIGSDQPEPGRAIAFGEGRETD